MSPETRFRIFVNILETFWLSIAVSNSGAFYEYNRDGPKPCREGEGRRAVTCDQAEFGRQKKKPDRRVVQENQKWKKHWEDWASRVYKRTFPLQKLKGPLSFSIGKVLRRKREEKGKIDNNCVIKLLSSLNPSKANGPDLLPTRALKEAATEIAPYLCFIFQQSINTGEVPPEWKHANVIAIFKKGSTSEAANYRPVS